MANRQGQPWGLWCCSLRRALFRRQQSHVCLAPRVSDDINHGRQQRVLKLEPWTEHKAEQITAWHIQSPALPAAGCSWREQQNQALFPTS